MQNVTRVLILTPFKILKVFIQEPGWKLYKNAANGEKHIVEGQVKVENNKVYGCL